MPFARALAVTTLALGAGAAAVGVTPPRGSPATAFTVSFRTPDRTGTSGSMATYDVASGATTAAGHGCVATFADRAPAAAAGSRVRVVLVPHPLAWCAGTYHGQVAELASPVCKPGRACPQYIVRRRLIGRFSFTVAASAPGADTAPPSFAGVKRAFACTPGAQRPGETTPFTLAWEAATDDRTPSARIVYDVYVSSTPGGENFATPTFTTPPGVTTFRTPGLPSHGTFYFVVRARDLAGNEDANTVEVRGVDPCY